MKPKRQICLSVLLAFALGLVTAPGACGAKSVVGGLTNSEVRLPDDTLEPVRATWTEAHVYALGGPVNGSTTCVEYLDPTGHAIADVKGVIHGEALRPDRSRDPIRVAWNPDHIYALGGPVGGITSSVEYFAPDLQPITGTLGVVNSEVLLPDLTTDLIRVAWNSGHIYALGGPSGGVTTSSEYMRAGMPISQTRGVITGDVRRPDQVLEPVRYAWTDSHIYALGGPVGGVTTSVECLNPVGAPISGTRGMLDTEVLLPAGTREPVRVAWTGAHVYAIGGPIGGITTCVEYLDPQGLAIAGVRGVIRAETQLADDSFAPITIVWTDTHVYALGGPVGGVTSCVEYHAPMGGAIAGMEGAIYTELLVEEGEQWKWRYVTMAWTQTHLYALRGPVGGVATTMEYFDPAGLPVPSVKGALNSIVRLPDGSREMIWVAWIDNHVYAFGRHVGGPAPCVEYLAPGGGPIQGTRGVMNSDVRLDALTREPVRIAWTANHVYALGGPVGGVTTCIEYLDPAFSPIDEARGIVHGEVRLPDGTLDPVAIAKTDAHIYALGGPAGGNTTCAEYFDPAQRPIPIKAEGIESFVYLYWLDETGSFAGAGCSGTPTVDALWVDEAAGASKVLPAVGDGDATVIGGPCYYDGAGPTLIVGIPATTLLVPYWSVRQIPGSMVMLGDATSGVGIGGAGDAGESLLSLAFPNPVAASTAITYVLPRQVRMELGIYDVRGRNVRMLQAGEQTAGAHVANWDGTNGEGRRVAGGIYYVCLKAGGSEATRKIIVLR